MTVDHRPLLARNAPLIRLVVLVGIGACGLIGGTVAGTVTFLTTKPKEK